MMITAENRNVHFELNYMPMTANVNIAYDDGRIDDMEIRHVVIDSTDQPVEITEEIVDKVADELNFM